MVTYLIIENNAKIIILGLFEKGCFLQVNKWIILNS